MNPTWDAWTRECRSPSPGPRCPDANGRAWWTSFRPRWSRWGLVRWAKWDASSIILTGIIAGNEHRRGDPVAGGQSGGLTIPKEALRREGDVGGVFLLAQDRITWRPVKLGVSSYTRAQVLSGLSEGDAVALPADKPLKDDIKVKPVFPGH